MSLLLSITPCRLFITTTIEGDNNTRASEKQTEMEVQREQKVVKNKESSKSDPKQLGIQESLGEEVEGELADEKTGRMPSLSPPSSVYGCVYACASTWWAFRGGGGAASGGTWLFTSPGDLPISLFKQLTLSVSRACVIIERTITALSFDLTL